MNSNIKIRRGTFETNSSSAHTLILKKIETKLSEDYIKDILDESGNLILDSECNFGRGFNILDTPILKLQYIIAWLGYDYVEEINDLFSAIKTRFPIIKNIYINFDSNPDTSKGDIDEIDYCYSDLFGSIDHQSLNMIDEYLKAIKKFPEFSNMSNTEILINTIFNEEIGIVIDSDETNTFEECILSGIISSTSIKYILKEEYDLEKQEFYSEFLNINDYLKESIHDNDDEE